MNRPRNPKSGIRRRLLLWLLPPLFALLLASLAADYRFVYSPANAGYDHSLSDTALALSSCVGIHDGKPTLALSQQAERVLRVDSHDRIYFAVRDGNGNLIAGDAELMPAVGMESENPSFYDGQVADKLIRGVVFRTSTPAGNVLIQVAETTVKRQLLAQRLFTALITPFVLIAFLVVAAVLFVVGAALEPLRRLRREVEDRSPQDLSPLPEEPVPEEVRPLIVAINRLLSRVAEATAAEQRFLANAAHQLRTPVTALQTQIELAELEDDPQKRTARLHQLAQATGRLSRLVQQLLALARATPAETVAMEPLDLRDIAEKIASSHLDAAIARDIDLGFECDPAHVMGIGFLLQELLTNLVDNALHYIPTGGRVTVRSRREGDACIMEVEDDGPGIPVDERDRVFDRFYRRAGSPGDGCGLGLSIVREIAELHGGRVDIVDAASPTGACVRVTLPAAPSGVSSAELLPTKDRS
jgi:two-component system sensor histidine kinase TctE